MKQEELAERLLTADTDEQAALLKQYSALADAHLAHSLKSLFDDTKNSDPERARAAVAALNVLARFIDHTAITALAQWTSGIAALLIDGQAERAITQLDA